MKRVETIIEGNIWAVEPCRRREMGCDSDGECDYENLTIRVYRDLMPGLMLETVIHEVIHAQQPDMTEEAVERRAREIARVLIKTGIFKRS